MKMFTLCAALYALVGIVTFGYSAAHMKCGTHTVNQGLCDDGLRTIAGLTAAVGWPLYWSWEAWS